MQITLIGANPYGNLPALLKGLLLGTQSPQKLMIMEPSPTLMQVVLPLAQTLAKAAGKGTQVQGANTLMQALQGAEVVVMAADVPDPTRWQKDRQAMEAVGLGAQVRQIGGLGGLMQTLRIGQTMLTLCDHMRALCPGAKLLLGTQPLGRMIRLCRQYGGIKTYGMDDVHARLLPLRVAAALEKPEEEITALGAGLPEFAVILHAKQGKMDLLGELNKKIEAGVWGPFAGYFANCYETLPASDPQRMAQVLPDTPFSNGQAEAPGQNRVQFAQNRLTQLMMVATQGLQGEGKRAFEQLTQATVVPGLAEAALALLGLIKVDLPVFCMPGGLQADQAHIVQGPAKIQGGKVEAVPIGKLPPQVGELFATLEEVNTLSVQAAATGSRSALRETLEIDPTLQGVDHLYALDVLNQMIEDNLDILPLFA